MAADAFDKLKCYHDNHNEVPLEMKLVPYKKRPLGDDSNSFHISVKKLKVDGDDVEKDDIKSLMADKPFSMIKNKKLSEKEVALFEKSIEEIHLKGQVEEKRLESLMRDIIKCDKELSEKKVHVKCIKNIKEIHNKVLLKIEKCVTDLVAKETELYLIEDLIQERKVELQNKVTEFHKVESKVMEIHRVMDNIDKERERKEEELKAISMLEPERKMLQKEMSIRRIDQRAQMKNFESINKQFQSREKKLESKEKQCERQVKELELKEKHFEERVKELESKEKQLEDQVKEFESREEEFQGQVKEFKSKKKHFNSREKKYISKEKQFEEKMMVLDSKEKQHEGWLKEFESKEGEFEGQVKELQSKTKHFDERVKELESKEKQLEGQVKDFESKKQEFEGEIKKLKSKKKQFKSEVKKHKSKEKQPEVWLKEFESKKEEFEDQMKELQSKSKHFESRVKEFKSKKKQFKGCVMEVESTVKELKPKLMHLESLAEDLRSKEKHFERWKDLESKEKWFTTQLMDIESKQNIFNGQLKDVELREKQHEVLMITFEEEKESDNQLSPSITIDGRSSKLLLSDQTDHDILVDLQASSDPSKDVLDIIQNPIIPRCMNGDSAVIIDSNRIALLEHLMRISPTVKPHVREEALKLALDLKANMNENTDNSLLVLAFLLLVSIYGLLPSFDKDEVFKFFGFAAHHNIAVDLFGTLGFADQISDFVQHLIGKKQYIVAVRFITAYNLVDKCQLVDLS